MFIVDVLISSYLTLRCHSRTLRARGHQSSWVSTSFHFARVPDEMKTHCEQPHTLQDASSFKTSIIFFFLHFLYEEGLKLAMYAETYPPQTCRPKPKRAQSRTASSFASFSAQLFQPAFSPFVTHWCASCRGMKIFRRGIQWHALFLPLTHGFRSPDAAPSFTSSLEAPLSFFLFLGVGRRRTSDLLFETWKARGYYVFNWRGGCSCCAAPPLAPQLRKRWAWWQTGLYMIKTTPCADPANATCAMPTDLEEKPSPSMLFLTFFFIFRFSYSFLFPFFIVLFCVSVYIVSPLPLIIVPTLCLSCAYFLFLPSSLLKSEMRRRSTMISKIIVLRDRLLPLLNSPYIISH